MSLFETQKVDVKKPRTFEAIKTAIADVKILDVLSDEELQKLILFGQRHNCDTLKEALLLHIRRKR